MRTVRKNRTIEYVKLPVFWTCVGVLTGSCMSTLNNIQPTTMIDGVTATVERSGDTAIVTLNAKNPSDFDGQQALVANAIEAAGVLTGCYVAPAPRKELDAYVAGAEPVRIAVDLQCL